MRSEGAMQHASVRARSSFSSSPACSARPWPARRPTPSRSAGVATDDTGGALPGATVTATNTATGLVRTAVTDSAGRYTVLGLPPAALRRAGRTPGLRAGGATRAAIAGGSDGHARLQAEARRAQRNGRSHRGSLGRPDGIERPDPGRAHRGSGPAPEPHARLHPVGNAHAGGHGHGQQRHDRQRPGERHGISGGRHLDAGTDDGRRGHSARSRLDSGVQRPEQPVSRGVRRRTERRGQRRDAFGLQPDARPRVRLLSGRRVERDAVARHDQEPVRTAAYRSAGGWSDRQGPTAVLRRLRAESFADQYPRLDLTDLRG